MSTSEAPPRGDDPPRRQPDPDRGIGATLSILLSTDWFARVPGRVSFWWDARPRVVGGFPRFLAWGPSAPWPFPNRR